MQPVLFSNPPNSRPNRKEETPDTDETLVLAGKRVVIVEDEGITQMQLRKILTMRRLEVVRTAVSGPEGVAIALQTVPDLVLMDINMPGEYNGLEATRRILAARSVCVVMLTAFPSAEYEQQAIQIGAAAYVTKPIDQDTLFPKLVRALRAFRPQ